MALNNRSLKNGNYMTKSIACIQLTIAFLYKIRSFMGILKAITERV